jgi:predicted transcriptional regulator
MRDRSFPHLIWRLIETRHKGNMLEMSQRADIPQSTLWRWLRALVRTYNQELILRLCKTYDLDLVDVMRLIYADNILRLKGRKIPVPDLSGVVTGPKPRT